MPDKRQFHSPSVAQWASRHWHVWWLVDPCIRRSALIQAKSTGSDIRSQLLWQTDSECQCKLRPDVQPKHPWLQATWLPAPNPQLRWSVACSANWASFLAAVLLTRVPQSLQLWFLDTWHKTGIIEKHTYSCRILHYMSPHGIPSLDCPSSKNKNVSRASATRSKVKFMLQNKTSLAYLLTFFLAFFLAYLLTFFSFFLTFILAYLLTFFLAYLLTFFLAFFLAYLLTFFSFFLTFILAYLLTFFLAYLLTFFLAYLVTFLLACLLTFFLAYLLILFLEYLLPCSLTICLAYRLTFFLEYLLTLFLTFFLAFYLANLLPHGWGPAANAGRGWSQLRSGNEHWARMIAVEVRQRWSRLRSGSTGHGWSQLRSGSEHWARMIAVEVRQRARDARGWGPVAKVDDRGWGPAANTGCGRSRLQSGSERRARMIAVESRPSSEHWTR